MSTRRFLAPLVIAALLLPFTPAQAGSLPPDDLHPWIAVAEDPARLADALTLNAHKVPVEFFERLRFGYEDGSIRVMVALSHRDAATESDMAETTTALAWYGESPRFFGVATRDQVTSLLEHPAVTFVEPDYPITNFLATSTIDARARSLKSAGTGVWSYDAATDSLVSDVPGLDAAQATGRGVTVAITDSGIDRTHKDFSGLGCKAGPYSQCDSRILKTVVTEHLAKEIPDVSGAFPTTELASGHGTHVAGTVGGNAYYGRDGDADPARYGADGLNFGVAPQASLISTKNGDSQSAGLSLFALQWQLDNAEKYGIKVSSNSWGCIGGCSFNGASSTAKMFKALYEKGVLVLFAAGNDGGGADGAKLSGNSQSPYVMGVAAYDDVNDQLASFSSRGSSAAPLPDPGTWTPESEPVNGHRRPDVAAPGVSIWAARTLTGGTSSLIPRANLNDAVGGGSSGFVPYAIMSGTSMATPHVAGAAALLFGACPQAPVLDVMRALMNGANETLVKKTGGGATAEAFEVGYGGLDARAAIDSLLAQPVCGGAPTNTAPSASISGPTSIDTGASATFDGSASSDAEGPLASYSWDFGDGSPVAEGVTVQHAFAQAGSYAVRLTVTDQHGSSATSTHSVAVVDPTGTIAGSVSEFSKRQALPGAKVDCGAGGSATTGTDGSFTLGGVKVGDYTCTASADGYRPESQLVTVRKDRTTIISFSLKRGGGRP